MMAVRRNGFVITVAMLLTLGCATLNSGLRFGYDYSMEWRQKELAKIPTLVTLHAPFTPFHDDSEQSLNLDGISALAANAKAKGVNTIWVPGSMGQFDTLSIQERKDLAEKWVEAGHALGLYIIVHVATTVLSDAILLAEHALKINADAIASVPPYYEPIPSIDQLISFFKPIVAAAPGVPFFYYHLPALTKYDPGIFELLTTAQTTLPSLIGIKYVPSPFNSMDWYNCVQNFNSSHALLFGPEPKLMSYGLGWGRGAVLAEDFYGATFLRMHNAYVRGDYATAWKETDWKNSAENCFNSYGGSPKRFLYPTFCSVEMGQPRLPMTMFNRDNLPLLLQHLASVDFFNRTIPPVL